jgi:hypothetical protein
VSTYCACVLEVALCGEALGCAVVVGALVVAGHGRLPVAGALGERGAAHAVA